MAVTLYGADAKDNVGIASLEYMPQLVDDSANYEVPDRLILSKNSIGRTYSVLVKTKDVGGNEAECRYSVTVKGKYAQNTSNRRTLKPMKDICEEINRNVRSEAETKLRNYN